QPDDLLHAPDLAVVAGVAPGALAHRQLVLEDPGEVHGRDACGPLASHTGTGWPTILAACTVAATSCTRTMAAPAVMAHTDVAREASTRSSTGAGSSGPVPVSLPRKLLRLAPTATSKPVSTRTPRWRRSERLCCSVFPKPMPGSIQTSLTPAATAARARSTR